MRVNADRLGDADRPVDAAPDRPLDTQRSGVMYAIGLDGQVITVDPAHDLVIVQLSTVGGDLPLMQTEAILDAFSALE